MLVLALIAYVSAAGAPVDPFDDVRRFAAKEHYMRGLWDLHDAPKSVPGVKRLVCGRTDRLVRSGAHRLVYVETADGSPAAIFEENDMPEPRAKFWQLWSGGGCK